MGFTSWDVVRKPEWIGFDNYKYLLGDPLFWKAVKNTLYFALITIPLKLIIGLCLAILCNQGLKGSNFFKLTFFFPATCSVVAIALLWGYIYGSGGALNSVLGWLGIDPVYWMEPKKALNSVAVMSIWASVGYNALLFLAGLQNIPDDYYEAAIVDGAGKWKQFWKITLPLLSPTTFFVLVIMLIGTLQIFGEVYILKSALNSTLSIVQYIYTEAFSSFRMGYASALSFVLIIFIIIITVIQFRLQKKWVNYDL